MNNGWQMLEFSTIFWGVFSVAHVLKAHYLEWLARKSTKRLARILGDFGSQMATTLAKQKSDKSKEMVQ